MRCTDKKIINVYGAARSGSTMMDLILGNDPRGFSLGEVCNWFIPYRTHHFDIKCGCGVYPCPVWENLKGINKREFHREALDRLNVDFLVDSSKYLPWIIDVSESIMRTGGIEVLNLLIYKDPVLLCHSYQKRGERAVERVVRAYKGYERFFDTGLPFVSLNYSQFTADPEPMLKQVCDVLGIGYFPGKSNFWTKTHHHLFGSSGIRRQLRDGQSQIHKEHGAPNHPEVSKQVEKEIWDNRMLIDIWRRLESNRVETVAGYPTVNDDIRIRKDLFYYKSKLYRYMKRYRPEPHPDKESLYI